MRLHLVDASSAVVLALQEAFAAHQDVTVQHGDILTVAHGALVSPANSNGFMDGGIDQQYAAFFELVVQKRVLEAVRSRPEGHLPVGASVVVPTDHAKIPYLIVAPTMFAPGAVEAANAYRALRAVLRLHGSHPALDGDVFCPGLATLTGRVSPQDAASEMAEAYDDWRRSENE